MAIATAYTAVNMNALSVWYGTPTIYNSTHIQINTGLNRADYYGTGFTFSLTGVTGGTVTRYDASYNGVVQYSISGLSLNAITVNGYLNAANANGLMGYAFAGNDTFNGSAGNDVLNSYNGNDIVYGNAGNDILNGGAGNDTMYGGAGNDTFDLSVNSRGGSDTMRGGAGNDVYWLDSALGDLVGENTGEGTDLIWANFSATLASLPNVENLGLYGTGNINATGNASNNVLYASSGNNVLNGGLGIDTADYSGMGSGVYLSLDAGGGVQYTAGSGTDTLISIENLTGSNFNDSLYGSNVANVLSGLAGNDLLDGGLGNDVMYGGAGNDKFDWDIALNNGGNDTMYGGAGNDWYSIDSTGDIVVEVAGEGVDEVVGRFCNVNLASMPNIENIVLSAGSAINATGNALNNTIIGNTDNNVLDGGAGIDTVIYTGNLATGVTVNLAITTAQNTGGAGSDTLLNIENLTGSNFNDVLTGNAGVNVLDGGAGNDVLAGGAGNDIMYGGAGNDTFDWAPTMRGGNDRMYGGTGNDVYVLDNASDQVVELAGEGTDIAWVTFSAYLAEGSNIENIGVYGSASINATGNSLNNVIYGNSGNNVLNGAAGIDTVNYLHSTITAGVNVSLAVAGAQITGGAGTDTLIGIENLCGTSYNDSLTGNAGNNVLNGDAGNDVLNGGAGNDVLDGGAGNDTLRGDAGNDVLCGGLGKDTLTSGANVVGGYNYFDFNAIAESVCGVNRDAITDFWSGADKIDLSTIDANTLLAGNQAFTLISGASAFTGAGQIKYANGILYGNVNGDNIADFEIAITLTNVTSLTAADFVL